MPRTSKGEKKLRNLAHYSNQEIQEDVERINKEEDLTDELGLFRMAATHEDHKLKGLVAANIVLVNLKISFTTQSGIKVRHTIPVLVDSGDKNTIAQLK